MKFIFILITLLCVSCASTRKERSLGPITTDLNSYEIPFDFKPEAITKACSEVINAVIKKVDAIANLEPNNLEYNQAVLNFEKVMANFDAILTPYIFVNNVHTDQAVRKSSLACRKKTSDFYINTFTDKKLYSVLKNSNVTTAPLKRLQAKMVLDFEENGLKLSSKNLEKVKKLLKKLSLLSTDFSNNIKEHKATLVFSKEQLAGVPNSILDIYKKDKAGHYIVTTSYPDYAGVMKHAKNAAVRKKVYIMRNTRAPQNDKVLRKVIKLRQKVARISGHKNWADYQTANGRMAKNSTEIWKFINNLKMKLRKGARSDLAKLQKLKKELKFGKGKVKIWEFGYLSEQYKKSKFKLDSEKVREYFPSKHVVKQMFEIYSELLGVKFEEIKSANTWHETVSLYKIIDNKTGDDIAYFYTDFIPRAGKYSHAAAFTLRPGRLGLDGEYIKPISAIVSNFNPATDKKPSLLSHGEVETLFHEFGHIMHQTLTKAPFAYLSGTSVERDFVEAPSQMLGEWVWSQKIINRVSGHYTDVSKKLPKEMLGKLLEMKKFNLAYSNTTQLYYGTIDMTFHSKSGIKNPSKVARDLSLEMTGLKQPRETHFVTSFGHLMGYSAGYYGYLWSKVYAIDMYSLFEKNGLINSEIGARYRKEILEVGSMRDASESLKAFLKRGPNQEPFYNWLGI